MIQKGHPLYSKRYMVTLNGSLRKEVELYKSANELKDTDALRELIRLGLEKKANPFFKSRFQR